MKSCLVCGSDEISQLTTIYNAPAEAQLFLQSPATNDSDSLDLEVLFCSYCGHVESAGHLVSYYKDVITASGSSKQVLKNRLDKIIHAVETYSDFVKPHLLDIGSGDFCFIDYIKTLDKFSQSLVLRIHSMIVLQITFIIQVIYEAT